MAAPVDAAIVFGTSAFLLHVCAYAGYATGVLRSKTKPNAASWLMWLFGAWVEFTTFDAIDHHWSSSALPFACMLGVGGIFLVTLLMQARSYVMGADKLVYEKSDRKDYWLIGADAGAYVLFLATGAAAWANWIAVATTIFTFYPIWKTTYRNPRNEQPWPWLLWSTAYVMMFMAVLAEGGDEVFAKSFYPLFYFALHLPVALLCFSAVRLFARRILSGNSNSLGEAVYNGVSTLHGTGVFAARNVSAGSRIGHVSGKVVRFVPESKQNSMAYPNWIGVGLNEWIDPEPPFVFLNHSCRPNCGIVTTEDGSLVIVAMYDIAMQEELTVDYSTLEGDPHWEMNCHCRTAECRGVIRSITDLQPEKYEEYRPYVQEYFRTLYERTHAGALTNSSPALGERSPSEFSL